jgi:hypothetical protein
MATEQNPSSRRPHHYHRGRRGPDRRGPDRRVGQAPDPTARSGDQVDVEQIMRDIRARIAQRQGIELNAQQIQELAARRLEAILDPRNVNPVLMQQLRRGAGAAPETAPAAPDSGYSFEQETLYETHRGLLRFMRRLLNPILKLFINPTPVAHALHVQSRLNREFAAREAERERLQAEWNALHYEVLQRLVTEVSRAGVEMQSLGLRIEALAGRVDFNDRRVRSLEAAGPQAQARPQARPTERAPERPPEPPATAGPGPAAESAGEPAAADAGGPETARRRRRRRRGRRGGTGASEAAAAPVVVGGSEGLAGPDTADLGSVEDEDDETVEVVASSDVSIAAEAVSAEPPPRPAPDVVPAPLAAPPEQLLERLSGVPRSEQPTPPPDEPSPEAPAPPDPGPPDR